MSEPQQFVYMGKTGIEHNSLLATSPTKFISFPPLKGVYDNMYFTIQQFGSYLRNMSWRSEAQWGWCADKCPMRWSYVASEDLSWYSEETNWISHPWPT